MRASASVGRTSRTTPMTRSGVAGHPSERTVSVRPTGDAHVHVQIDGEFVGEAPAEVSLGPGAIRVLVPERYGRPV